MTTRGFRWLTQILLEVILIILCMVFSFTADGFFTIRNFTGILRNISIQGIIALGMTLVIIAGEIDLSVGSAVAFSGCLLAWIVQKLTDLAHPPSAAIAIALGCGAALACG